eukprot:GDKK01004447.1.p1 GENE.GDKK01004447.1~~GDKK01004447.1.p1  ORF type:complete len:126 (+),score=3.05 GDKK01004447.1:12-389(+)
MWTLLSDLVASATSKNAAASEEQQVLPSTISSTAGGATVNDWATYKSSAEFGKRPMSRADSQATYFGGGGTFGKALGRTYFFFGVPCTITLAAICLYALSPLEPSGSTRMTSILLVFSLAAFLLP